MKATAASLAASLGLAMTAATGQELNLSQEAFPSGATGGPHVKRAELHSDVAELKPFEKSFAVLANNISTNNFTAFTQGGTASIIPGALDAPHAVVFKTIQPTDYIRVEMVVSLSSFFSAPSASDLRGIRAVLHHDYASFAGYNFRGTNLAAVIDQDALKLVPSLDVESTQAEIEHFPPNPNEGPESANFRLGFTFRPKNPIPAGQLTAFEVGLKLPPDSVFTQVTARGSSVPSELPFSAAATAPGKVHVFGDEMDPGFKFDLCMVAIVTSGPEGPKLSVERDGEGVRVTWPKGLIGFELQGAERPDGPWAQAPGSRIVEGEYAVPAGNRGFFRLSGN